MELEKFLRLTKYVGTRVDFVQGSGGNESVKTSDKHMLIKSVSGNFQLNKTNSSHHRHPTKQYIYICVL
jgi:rhamnose utilization protein RhaD (predicted bifunctional aldolase and dehydrogenase)